ncbi:DUF4913 domain-containing protein [Arthrobacter globiformis]|uniref:DUF4913 domain-containing protein n=1 Tax=Arthrobacter globiformis TaxID=1665 RepID=UPI0027D8F9CE|nr:DUF4913 domain-containing protein [Arthrobacter globiformis]
MSVWWRDHADHHMGVLLSADGPFKGCKPVAGGHAANKLKILPCEPPPPGALLLGRKSRAIKTTSFCNPRFWESWPSSWDAPCFNQSGPKPLLDLPVCILGSFTPTTYTEIGEPAGHGEPPLPDIASDE